MVTSASIPPLFKGLAQAKQPSPQKEGRVYDRGDRYANAYA
jgi:hypothetical protein